MNKVHLIAGINAMEQSDFVKSISHEMEFLADVLNNEEKVIVYEGTLELKEHLILDRDTKMSWAKAMGISDPVLEEHTIAGFIVMGNLSVQGSIINEEGDYGPFLFVAGDVNCQSLLVGGSLVYISGNITAEEVVLLHYNHGWMKCNGTISAPVLIADDFQLIPGKMNISQFYHNTNDPDSPEEYEIDYTDEDCPFSPDLRVLLDEPSTKNYDHLIRDIAAGEYVLLGPRAPQKDEAYWEKKVLTHTPDLKRVPEAYKTLKVCMAALESNEFAIQFFPPHFIDEALCLSLVEKQGILLKYLPKQYITKELCFKAAEKGAALGYDIPPEHYDNDLMHIIIKHSSYQMELVPQAFITKSLLVTFTKTGNAPFLDKYCRETNISKQEVLFQVIDDGVEYLENIFGWHLSTDTYNYAKSVYDNTMFENEWMAITQKYEAKIGRLKL